MERSPAKAFGWTAIGGALVGFSGWTARGGLSLVAACLCAMPLPAGAQDGAGKATELVPLALETWVTNDDYPTESIVNNEFGIVAFKLHVDTAGKPVRCNIMVTSGFRRLDEATCAFMGTRAKFKPARNENGVPIPATYTKEFSWLIPGFPLAVYNKLVKSVAPPTEIALKVAKLPPGYRNAALVRLVFADGKSVCTVEESSGSPAADAVACSQAQAGVDKPPFRLSLVTQPDTAMAVVGFEIG